MLDVLSDPLAGGAICSRVRWNGAPLTTGQVLERLRSDSEFRAQWLMILAAVPFAAYFWETPALTRGSLERPFECVFSEAPGLAGEPPDPEAFREHFSSDNLVAFDNLTRDARLVVPCPMGPLEAYAHLAAFVRGAPARQQHSLFQRVAEDVLARVSEVPLWLSTAGMAVSWLHVRIDSRPKYYRHQPYRRLGE